MNENPVPLRLQGICKTFGPVRALQPLTLEIEAGEMLALLGPSGCGKTTTLRIIAGFEAPDAGRVLIGPRDVTDLPPNHRGLGMVFQDYSLFPHMSVAENVGFGLRMRRVSVRERAHEVAAALDMVRLSGFGDRSIHQLSGGQQQRVALARSLVTRPSILLLDEPLGALDKNLRERMQFELRDLQRRLGITSVLVTHDQEEALTMSDRVAVMSAGEVVQMGRPSEVYEHPRTRFVSEFLGTANIFTGTVTGAGDAGGWSLALDVEGAPRGLVAGEGRPPVGERVMLAVRPERMALATAKGAPLRAKMRDVVFRGTYYAYEAALPGRAAPVFVYSQAYHPPPSDGWVGLSWPADCGILLTDPVT